MKKVEQEISPEESVVPETMAEDSSESESELEGKSFCVEVGETLTRK